jgi:cytochrome c5
MNPIAALAFAGVLVLATTAAAQNAAPLPDGPGRELVETACSGCHNLRPITIKRDGQNGWRSTVERMVMHGARLLPEEAGQVVDYLSRSLGPGASPMQTGMLPPGSGQSGPQLRLPEGRGKELVENRCRLCHDLGRLATRRTADEWHRITRNMVMRGPSASPAEVEAMIAYLTTHFGRRPERSGP